MDILQCLPFDCECSQKRESIVFLMNTHTWWKCLMTKRKAHIGADTLYLSKIKYLICVHFTSFIIPCRGGWMRTLSSARKTDQANFTDWMSILPSNLTEEISPNTEALRANTLSQFVSKKIWLDKKDND